MKENQIICPSCGTPINVQNALSNQLEDQIRKDVQEQLHKESSRLNDEKEALKSKQKELDEKAAMQDEILNQKVNALLNERSKKQEEELKRKLQIENQDQFDSLQKELSEKSTKLQELNKTKAEVERLRREKDELKSEVEAEAEKELNQKLREEKDKIKKTFEESSDLKLKELKMQLEQQKKLTEEMRRKQEQGSMQLQGEVQELAIEEWLMENFPFDNINEIKKGVNGADCLQVINTRERQNCGSIYFESKRTKAFSTGWIEKFKNDIREKKADIGVIVTQTMPSDMARMGIKDGVWICTFDEFKGLSIALRESIIRVSHVLATQENKGGKMEMLYNYLTGPEFKMQIDAIVEGFTQMQNDLRTEKNAMNRIWSQREKQLEKVLLNTTGMYGSLKGIAGNAIANVEKLELPGADTED